MVRSSSEILIEINDKRVVYDELLTIQSKLEHMYEALSDISETLKKAGSMIKEVGSISKRTLDNNGEFSKKGAAYGGIANFTDNIYLVVTEELLAVYNEIEDLQREYVLALERESAPKESNTTQETQPRNLIRNRVIKDFQLLKY